MSATTRPVREDQHGTHTGYVYEGRCGECREAAREELIDRVYAALEREADFDDVSTASTYRLGELAGVSQKTARWAIWKLAEQGRITIAGRVGRGGSLEIHLGATA